MTVENLNITVKTNADKAAAKLLTLGEALERVQGSAASVGGGTGERAAKSVEKVGKAAGKANKPLGNFLSSLKRIAFYRIIRGIIKSITQAFSEGLEKAYLFSSAMGEDGNRFAAAMDKLKSESNQMKGQLGSAFIALLTAIKPILLQLIDLVTRAADAIAQFFAAFTGKTYLKATDASAKFADNMKRGGGAAKEWKNQLLGFDEINRLNEPSSGGGGGGSNDLDGFAMEAADISEGILSLVDKIKRGDIAALFADIFSGIGDAILRVDWKQFGSDLWERVKTLFARQEGADSAVGAFFNALGRAFGAVVGFGWGFLDGVVDDLFAAIKRRIIDYDGDNKITLKDIFRAIINFKIDIGKWIFDEVIEPFARGIAEGITGEEFEKLTIDPVIDAGKAIVKGLMKGITGSWEDDGERQRYIEFFAKLISGVKELFGIHSPSTVFASIGENIVTGLVDGMNSKRGFLDGAVSDIFGGIISWCRQTHTWIQDVINGIGIVGLGSVWQSGGGFSGRVGSFASGGFPTEGQLFLANEGSAPEMVGTMGGRTTVATNADIVEGIRQGVYDAVVAANGSGSGDVQVRVYLDSREIKAGQQRLNRAWGV